MKKFILLIFISCFSLTAMGNLNYEEEELEYLKTIKEYKDMRPYLSEGELNTVKVLRKKKLILGTEPDSLVDAEAFKRIMKKHLDVEVTLDVRSWSKILKGLKDGEIDIVLNLSHSNEREEYINYSGAYYTDIAFLIHPLEFPIEGIQNFKNKEIRYTKGSIYENELNNLAKKFEFEATPKEILNFNSIDDNTFNVSSRTQVYKMVGEKNTGLNYTELFIQSPVYLGISNTLSKDEIEVIKNIFNTYVGNFLNGFLKIYEKNLGERFIKNSLTDKELIYLLNLETMGVTLEKNQYPLSFSSDETHEIKGSWLDILKTVKMKFEYIPVSSYRESLEFLDNNINGIALLPISIENLKHYNISAPLYTISYFLVSNKYSYSNFREVGIAKDSYYLDTLYNISLNIRWKIYEDDIKLVEALKAGEIDSIILSENKLRFFQNERLKTFLYPEKILGTLQLGVAANKNNKVIIGIFNKILKRSKSIKKRVKKWEYLQNKIGIKYERSTRLLIVLQSILIIFLIYLVWVLRRLYVLAFYHKETGVPNERLLLKRLSKIKFNKREENNIGIIAFSIKNSHEVSDLYSKDEIFHEIKKIFSNSKEVIYRLNKNEYSIVITGKSQDKTYEEVKNIMEKNRRYYIGEINLKFSFGMSHLSSSKNIEELVKNALYSLHLSRDEEKVVIGTPRFLEKYRATKELEYKIEKALGEEKFIPFFQPKIKLINGNIQGAEALARYIDHRGKYVSPGVFIPLLEKNNLIGELDLQMLSKSLKITKKWLDDGTVDKDFIISQNLSVKTLESRKIYQSINEILIKREFPVENLEFEVTETALGGDLDLIINNLSEIKSLGISISIDDFSAGNSSLNYVAKLPIDVIKLDMSILPVSKDETSKIDIYGSFVDSFKRLGYKVVSEGVESFWQDDFLRKLKVDEAQGYLYSKPVGKEEFEGVIKKNYRRWNFIKKRGEVNESSRYRKHV